MKALDFDEDGYLKIEFSIDDLPVMYKIMPEFLLLHSYLLGHNFIVTNFIIEMVKDLHPLKVLFKDNSSYTPVSELTLYGVKGSLNLLDRNAFEFKYGKDIEWKIYFSIEVK